MKFTEMNLADYIVEGLTAQGIETATEIQELTLPLIKSGADVIGLSQTGSGKTYAYGIAALEQVDTELNSVQFLVVCPTRELAAQVAEDFRKLTSLTSKIRVAPIFGGSSMDRQVQSLKRGAKIVIGTPGRLMDHLRRKTLKLDNLKMVILDEADEMLNMGFKEDIETILKTTPSTRQTVMFSATMPPEIQKITKQYMREPVLIKTKNQDIAHALIKQYYVNCKRTEKTEMLGRIYEQFNPWISIVFCNTIKMTEELSKALVKNNMPAVCLHGDMRQNERKRVMENFKKDGNGGILVATDVAARGIDIKNVELVVNYDFPNNEDYYVHRIGRTGRAGKEGIAITIINNKQQLNDLTILATKDKSKIEEYATLSTAQWSVEESKRSNARKQGFRQDFRSRNNNPRRDNKREDTKHERFGFNSNNQNHASNNRASHQNRKRANFQDINNRKNKDGDFGTMEIFEMRDNYSQYGKDGQRKGAPNRFVKSEPKKEQLNKAPAKKEFGNRRDEQKRRNEEPIKSKSNNFKPASRGFSSNSIRDNKQGKFHCKDTRSQKSRAFK